MSLRDEIADAIIYHPANRNADEDARERIAFMLADAVLPVVDAHIAAALNDDEIRAAENLYAGSVTAALTALRDMLKAGAQ